ncbi:hypothetical protein ACFONN_18790 [Dyella humi]|uniref:Lipoprotein n=1 Tax=Dyella humi TaxID=1770547 RepID=A0ABW8IGJ4_9GAMM
MKRAMVVLLSLMCAACAPVVTKVNVPDIAKSDSLLVRDMRPANEKDKNIFSLLISNDKYGIIRTGDERLSPSPVRLLQYQAFEKFKSEGNSPELDVYHFVVYQNNKSQLTAGTTGAVVGGLVGALVANALSDHDVQAQTKIFDERTFDRSANDEYQRGFFTHTENPDKAAVYIVYIDTDIGGKKVFTRTLAPMHKHGDQDPLASAVQLAIRNHLSHYDVGTPLVAAVASTTPAVVTPTPILVATANVTAASPTPAVAAAPTQVSAASAAMASMARDVASQMGCGAIQDNGDSTFVAPCGSYGVLIDCDGSQCRPVHTVKIKGNE